jgi:uncharacterized protein (DUF433 family)
MAPKRKMTTKKSKKEKKNGLLANHTFAHIEIDAEVMLGKPVIRGTRIPVELILRKLGEGATEADLVLSYPRLTHEDILAAISYGGATVAHDEPLAT